MIIIKITSETIRTDGNEYGASYSDIQNISFIEVSPNEDLDEVLEKHQRNARGKAKFIMVEGKVLDVPYVKHETKNKKNFI